MKPCLCATIVAIKHTTQQSNLTTPWQDKHYAHWLHIWNELTQTAGHQLGYANMVGNTPDLYGLRTTENGASSPTVVAGKTLYIPLQFWYCRNAGLALPLIALQYHEVKINIEFEQLNNLYWAGSQASSSDPWVTNQSVVTPSSIASASLYVDYIYLDAEERRRFAQVSHEYLLFEKGRKAVGMYETEINTSQNPLVVSLVTLNINSNTTAASIGVQEYQCNIAKMLEVPKACNTKLIWQHVNGREKNSDMVKICKIYG